jgi:hypothetical protein
MSIQKVAIVGCVLLFASTALFAQVVEKSSASFTFPTNLTSAMGKQVAPGQATFFRTTGNISRKGVFTVEWSVPTSASQGRISVYSISGVLIKNLVLTKNQGSLQCDLSRSATGIYLATISYGTYRQNLKLALYK